MTTSPAPTTSAAFRKSYPLDLNLSNDDQQGVLYITDDPAGHKLHLDISNASGQTITLGTIGNPPNSVASATNYHFAVRFRPDTLSSVFQSYLTYAISTLQGSKPAALSDTLQGFATETYTALQALQQQGWNPGYAQELDGSVVLYLLSTQAQTLAPAAKISVTFPHAIAAGASGARSTRVELNYQHLSLDNNVTLLSGRRQSQLSIVNQRGQKNIPLHISFVGANTILNDGKSLNTLTLRITNVQKGSTISLNPAGSNMPSKFVLSFDVQPDGMTTDWALGTTSQVHAMQVTTVDAGHWSVTASSGQEQVPEWILMPLSSKPALAPNEAVTLTLSNIISSLPPGQTNLYISYENIPGFWDGQFVVPLEKTPLLYRGANVGIGTTSPNNQLVVAAQASFGGNASNTGSEPVEVQGAGAGVSFYDRSGGATGRWVIYSNRTGAAGTETLRFWAGGDKAAITQAGNVGIGTDTPHAPLEVKGTDFQLSVTNAQDHNWGFVNWTDDKLYFQYREQGAYKNNAMWLDKTGHLTLNGISVNGNIGIGTPIARAPLDVRGGDFQFCVTNAQDHNWGLTNWTDDKLYFQYREQGVFKDNMMWLDKEGNLTIKGHIMGSNKFFRIEHPAKPDEAYLIHACLEGPESSVYYRGRAQLVDGRAVIRLPDYFEPLTRSEGRTVLLTPEGREPFLLSYESIVDGTFNVYGTRHDGAFSWEVKAVRADVERLVPEIDK